MPPGYRFRRADADDVGRSLEATTDYLAGTLGGAIFAGAVGALIPHDSEMGLVVFLAIALVPVARPLQRGDAAADYLRASGVALLGRQQAALPTIPNAVGRNA